jgi:hypothetical protein
LKLACQQATQNAVIGFRSAPFLFQGKTEFDGSLFFYQIFEMRPELGFKLFLEGAWSDVGGVSKVWVGPSVLC